MFCSGCGTKIQENLSYCSQCGKRASDERSDSRNALITNLTSAVGFVGSAGFIGFIFVVLILAKSGVPANQIIPISVIYFAALFGICFMIMRQLSAFNNDASAKNDIQPPASQAAYLHPNTTARLNEPADMGIGSVTDHTTRTLERTPVERS
ncbi:MAG: hypothetical protein KF685_09325 [Acidobacteria bacterium]|nr:hypothetical protein [Acidobacteriota bacterium]